MTLSRGVLLGAVCVVSGSLLAAQEQRTHPAANNPHLGNPQSIRSGMAIYRVRCGDCHGLDASGYRGPDLTALDGRRHDRRTAVPDDPQRRAGHRDAGAGNGHVRRRHPDDDRLPAQSRRRGRTGERPVGNVENGARLFARSAPAAIASPARGGRIGPDLTRIGISRSRAALIREIRTPSEWVPPAFETVTRGHQGRPAHPRRQEERGRVFSIQVMDTRERIQGYLKANLQEVIYEKNSLMPAFGAARLNDSDLNDLVGYLTTLRGADVTGSLSECICALY